jgi:hypothetical protein
MGDALESRAPPYIDYSLGINRRLAGKRLKDRRRESRTPLEKTDQRRERHRANDGVGERSNRVKCRFKKASWKTEKITRQQNVLDLVPPVAKNAIANVTSLPQHEQCLVATSLDDDVAVAAHDAGGRMQRVEDLDVGA